jgi:hypothetical protein
VIHERNIISAKQRVNQPNPNVIEEAEEEENLPIDVAPRPESNYTSGNGGKGRKKNTRIMLGNLNMVESKSLKRPISAVNLTNKGLFSLAKQQSLKHVF